MPVHQSNALAPWQDLVLLGIDTCGPSGSVALGRLTGSEVEILEQMELEGRTYSATLVAAVADLLARHRFKLADLGCIVAVDGPGSFTGVRIGLSAVKGLAEAAALRVVAVSRLEVLSHRAGTTHAAIDAHRHELFLRLADQSRPARELLVGAVDLRYLSAPPDPVAICDDPAAALLADCWPTAQIIRVTAPTASDALHTAAQRIRGGDFADIALLDGRYLRRSDAEIFGDSQVTPSRPA